MENSGKGVRRAKRVAAQGTKAYFINGEWDDIRALNKALLASMTAQKNIAANASDSESDSDSTVNSVQSTNNGPETNGIAGGGGGDTLASETAMKKKLIKYGNKMSTKTKSLRKIELPKMMFKNYIPNAADLFQWIRNTSVDELRNVPKTQTSFPSRGLDMREYERKFKNVDHSAAELIPKTDEALPDIFKDYYRLHREEYLRRLKQDRESTSSRDETQWSSKSSTKENGHINSNTQYEEIFITDNSDDEQADDSVEEEIVRPLKQRTSTRNSATNNKEKIKINNDTTIKKKKKKKSKDKDKSRRSHKKDIVEPNNVHHTKNGIGIAVNVNGLVHHGKNDVRKSDKNNNNIIQKSPKKHKTARKSQREEIHQRANLHFNNAEVKNRLRRAENRTITQWAMQQVNTNGNKHNDSDESSSSSSDDDDDDQLPLPSKRPKLRNSRLSAAAGAATGTRTKSLAGGAKNNVFRRTRSSVG